jgi:hypothetical protein
MSSQLVFLYFRYFDGGAWVDTWHSGSSSGGAGSTPQLPMAVEVTLGTSPVPEEMTLEDYLAQYPTFRREIFIPAGKRELSGTVIQGAPGVTP